jgi:hypothetical protein
MLVQPLRDYHHFKRDLIDVDDAVARCERYVVDRLLTSNLSDADRDSSVAFELKHHAAVTQFARLVARKRELPLRRCTVGALLHDIYVIEHGTYSDHAHQGAPLADRITADIGGFTEQEAADIRSIVYHHSDKHVWSDDVFAEFGKDVDILDCFLYPGAFDYYLKHKPLAVFMHYLMRAKKMWAELGVPPDPRFSLLDGYGPSWFDSVSEIDAVQAARIVSSLSVSSGDGNVASAPPPCLIAPKGSQTTIAFNRAALVRYCADSDGAGIASGNGATGGGQPSLGGGLDMMLERAFLTQDVRVDEGHATLRDARASDRSLLVWPVLERYELIDVGAAGERLGELGLTGDDLDRGGAR